MNKELKKLSDEEKEKIAKAKEELREYRENIKYIRELGEDLTELREDIVSTTTKLSPSKTILNSMCSDKFSDKLDKISEIEKDRAERLDALLLKKFTIDKKIDSMVFPYRDVLFMRYARGKSWNAIANELDYDIRYTHKIHSKALLIYANL